MEDLNHLDIWSCGNSAGHKKTMSFQECVDDSFWTGTFIKQHLRRAEVPEFIIRHKKEVAGD